MSAVSPCVPSCCSETQTTNVPGTAGTSAIAATTASFVVPAVGSTVAVSLSDTSMLFASSSVGTNLFIGGGNFMVTAIGSATSATLMFLGLDNDTIVAGNTVASGSVVSPGLGAYKLSVALSAVANFTDSTTGSATSTLAAGVGVFTLVIPVILVKITGAMDVLSAMTPGFKFKILGATFAVSSPVTTGAKLATLSFKISGSAVTGGAMALTSANCTPLGALVAGTSVTALNTGSASDTLSVVATAVTAFSEGEGYILLKIQNMDSADAVASFAAKWAVLTALLGKP